MIPKLWVSLGGWGRGEPPCTERLRQESKQAGWVWLRGGGVSPVGVELC